MTSRAWAAIPPAVVLSVVTICAVGCRREATQFPATAARTDLATHAAAEVLTRYLPVSPTKPDSLTLGTDLRILAPYGYFDRYDPIDRRRERIPDDVPLYLREDRITYTPISRVTAAKLPPTETLYAYRRAPALDRFEKDYGISVAIAHFSDEEMSSSGVGAERTQDFDLVFGPRGMLPVVLDKNNLAPFDVAALTRFAQPRIYINEALGRLPDDTDLDFNIPYFRSAIGIGHNLQVVDGIPRNWSDGFESERTDLYWHRVLLRGDPFVLFSAAILYQRNLPPEERRRAEASTRQLLDQVAALAASSISAGNKSAELQHLRQKFAAAAQAEHQVGSDEFSLHTATFTSAQSDGITAKLHHPLAVAEVENPDFESDQVVLAARDLLKRLLVFGADFFDERTDQARLTSSDWAYLIGTSARPFALLADDPRYGFSLPAPKSPVELDIFVMPANRDELSRQTSEFLVNYLLIPEVAASMTTFSGRATVVRDSVAFLPTEITNSPIFSLPEPQDIVYLPILAGDAARLRQIWDDIVEFRETIRSMDETNSDRRAEQAKHK